MDVFKLWVVEYSEVEHTFAVAQLGQVQNRNLQLFLSNQPNDRVILAFAASHEVAEEMLRAFDCRRDRTKPFTPAHLATIKELLEVALERLE